METGGQRNGFDPDHSEEAKKRRQRHRSRGAPAGGFQGGNEAKPWANKNGLSGATGRGKESQRQPEKMAARDQRSRSVGRELHDGGTRNGWVLGAEDGVGGPKGGRGRGGSQSRLNERPMQERGGGFDPDHSEEAKKRRQRHRSRGAPAGGFQGGNEAKPWANKNGLSGATGRGKESHGQPEKMAARDWRSISVGKELHDGGTRNGRVLGAEGGVGGPKGGRGRGRGGSQSLLNERGDERRGWSAHPAGRGMPPNCHKIGYKKLQGLCEEEPSVVALTLSSHQGLKDLLNDRDMRKDLVQLVCEVLSKALKSRTERATKQHLVNIIKDSEFFRATLMYSLAGMESESDPARRHRHPQLLGNILTILLEVITMFPASSVQTARMVLTQLKSTIDNLKAIGVDIDAQIEESMQRLQDLIRDLQERHRDGTLRSDRDTFAILPANGPNPGEEEQEDFRTIPTYPTHAEFHKDEKPFLRLNLTSQSYMSSNLYLDTHFRLMREDFVRPLRDGIQYLLMQAGGREGLRRNAHFDEIRVYFDTKLLLPKFTRSGIAHVVQFDVKPLKFVRWQNSKRLIYGSLVCLSCDLFESFLFATVSNRDPKELEKGRVEIIFTEECRSQLATVEKDQVFLMVETTAYFEAYRYVLDGLRESEEDDLPFQRYIVECKTDVQPCAYLRTNDICDLSCIADPERKTKKSLQPFHCLSKGGWPTMEELGLDDSQMKALQLALTKELAIIQGPPGTGKTHVGLKIARALLSNLWKNDENAPPMLVVCFTNHALDQFLEGILTFLHKGIVRVGGRSDSLLLKPFNLRELTNTPGFRHSLPPHLRRANADVIRELDEIEREITRHTVMVEYSMKKVLSYFSLKNFMKDKHWDDLCRGIENLKRSGLFPHGRSKMIEEWLGVSFSAVQKMQPQFEIDADELRFTASTPPIPSEAEDFIDIVEEADLIQEERMIDDESFDDVSGRANAAAKEMMLTLDLEEVDVSERPYEEISEEEWQFQQAQKKKIKRTMIRELAQSSAMTEMEEDAIRDIWSLSLTDRWRLYRTWVTRYRAVALATIEGNRDAYQNTIDRMAEIRRNSHLFLLKKAKVVGMTTTGAAKYRQILQQLKPRLVIVEEAAEVLEAHTITTLSKECQHLILIGDHQQLRPSATVYDLAKNFNLELSMFERLVNMGLPFVRLNYQHRMRPEIASLLTPHIYEQLENHPSVFEYENIKGITSNLFFVEHDHFEKECKEGKSHQNEHEAKFVVALCRYLLLQEYKPEQITILTTYTAQLLCLRKLMLVSEFKGVRVHVVDKYQGEENDIILLSLVRSNAQGKVGFLNIPNRVCVALSRAKKGLYCIGNGEMLRKVKLWNNILATLRKNKRIGDALTLSCQNHPNRQIEASCAEDFNEAPEGGCTLPCEFRLDCGHVCTRVCHPYDVEHKVYKCPKNCERILCDDGHQCPLVCHQNCPKKCPVRVEKVIPQCLHTQKVPCHQDPSTYRCLEPCQKLLPCGHRCRAKCGDPCTEMCQEMVDLTLRCGHTQKDACYYKKQPEEPPCWTPCGQLLKCGHVCPGSCHVCFQGRFHSPCGHQCRRLLICSHECTEPCSGECPPCSRPCENRCFHSQCKKQCGQACVPCSEPCSWSCPHQRCSKLCHEPCDRPPCTKPCRKVLKCGHQCIGLCGDRCPTKCRVCHRDEVTEIFFGKEDEPLARFIQLEDCGHVIEHTAMDLYMQMDDSHQGNGGDEIAIKLKECPRCRTPIRKNRRYGLHINRSLAEIEMVKRKVNGNEEDIKKQRKKVQKKLEINSAEPLKYVYHAIAKQLNADFLTANHLHVLETKIEFFEQLEKLKNIQTDRGLSTESSSSKAAVQLVSWLRGIQLRLSEQQVHDLLRELQRVRLLTELDLRWKVAVNSRKDGELVLEVQALREVLEKIGQFTEDDEDEAKRLMNTLDAKLPSTGLVITEEERKMIVSAMKMRPGHWYKCPNGHIYVITECGGAMESRQCPDCSATIGGASHTLASGNQVASEMDGAQHAAWSEANNLLNYGQYDLI